MSGLLLRLAGVWQAWGQHAAFPHHRDTALHPTRSGLIGLITAAQGRTRDNALTPYEQLPGRPSHHDLTFTVRVDNPGTPHEDYHTVGGGHPPDKRLYLANGSKRTAQAATLVSRRHYLAGAVFTVAVTGPDPLIDDIADALDNPAHAPFLGRRACIPDEPLVLGPPLPDPITELLTRAPVSWPTPPTGPTAPVILWSETPPTDHPHTSPDNELAAEPTDWRTEHRTYLARPLWRTTEHLPAHLYAGKRPIDTLTAYLHKDPAWPPTP
ncbi:CRISPR-associated protein, Cas5e family [Streptomyces sp. TLI_053]|uniref:type I-E CRISPR-associated protein Cas5/CasD n=1 Tax=Streptomyces sp. TLI_053 TaxID=1855352 RepID=UPI00087DBE30|nr:type I-E CRISPR-associated protein Cas5/CasD [Streptomyces sp. TLI_053]SDS49790.1 CRISPR-associated protein, Cas5e family [Streptomyces sp. TLI_053]